jgi:hypothetical protein
MRASLDPFSFLVVSIAGWMNQHQQNVIEYLTEENCILRDQPDNSGTGRDHRHAGGPDGLASEVDCQEV